MKQQQLLVLSITLLSFYCGSLIAQTTTFDNLNANPSTNKAITWTSSNWGSGFGHRIINSDPGGQTLLNFQGRDNTANWSTIMALTSKGNIGIGTTNPNQKIHVDGTLGVGRLGSNYTEGLKIKYVDGGSGTTTFKHNRSGGYFHFKRSSSYGERTQFVLGGSSNHFMDIYNNNNEVKVRLNSGGHSYFNGGNVGIGTTSPQHRLHVTSGVQLRKTTIGATSASSANSWIRDDWLTGFYGPPKWNQSTEKWVRPGGTYNDVGGIIFQDEGTYFIRDQRGTQLEYTNNEFLGKAYSFADIFTGNVGIGTNTPDSKLTVKGKIHSREVKVTATAGGADFVFANNYKLPTLEEVEQFITENKHLPEIASAKEMEENGIHLAEMNIKLLQKIEELTLYTIEQQKKIEKLSCLTEENKLLQQKFDALEALVLKMINK